MQRRAIGIVRVSRSDGRSGDSFSSPRDQADRLVELAEREGWELTLPEPFEIDVSGNALLADRPQLSRAVVAVQTGQAEIIAGAHTERLWWNHETATQVIRLVEDANGEVWSADQGLLTRRSAADEFSGTVRTAADRLSRRQNAEKTVAAIQRAIDRGVPPWPRVTYGYRKRDDGTYEPHPTNAKVVRAAFEQRAAGLTIREVRAYLQRHEISMTYTGAVKLLKSRVVLGEIHFGKFTPNLSAHDPIVPRATWEAVQRARVPSGRNTRNPRLLARLGVLLCGTCNARMSANTVLANAGRTWYDIYRCQNPDCTRRVTISAPAVEQFVVDAIRAEYADVQGRATAGAAAEAADALLEHTQGELDAAIRVLSVVGDEPIAIERLAGLRDARDRAREDADRLRGVGAANAINVTDDWDRLTLAERRAAISGTVESVHVAPGRGRDRVSIEFIR